MSRLLGLHVNSLPGGLPELLAAWRPPVAVTLVPGPTWFWLKAVSPRTLIIYRHIEGESAGGAVAGLQTAPQTRVDAAIAAGSAGAYDYLQLTNEPPVPNRETLATIAAWEAEAVRYAAGKGVRLAIGNFSVGNPSDLTWWDAYRPALEAGAAHGAVLNLHEYNYPSLQSDDSTWYNLRHRQVYARLAAAGLPQLPLVIGECGLDAGTRGGGAYGSWQGHIGAAEYLRQLEAWDRELQADPYVLGAAIFCAGQADGWWAFNVFPEPAATLAQAAEPLYRTYCPSPGNDQTGGGGSSLGCDVSWWQGSKVDWTALARSGLRFAILRASCGLAPDGAFERNWRLCGSDAPAIRREAYHYVTDDDPAAQVLTCLRQVRGRPVPRAWADLEESGLTDRTSRAFVEDLEQALGSPVGIYTSWYKARAIRLGKWAGSHPLWVADWRGKPEPLVPDPWRAVGANGVRPSAWTYWQYSVAPSWPGVPGRLDLNRRGDRQVAQERSQS